MIVGTPRSGTTLLQRLAVESCEFRSAPETSFFSLFPRMLSDGAPRSRQRSREHITRALASYSESTALAGANLQPDPVLALLEGRVVNIYDIFEAVVAVLSGGPDRLCEKTPGHLWWWEHIASARPSTRFAMIVRDPRAVVASMVEAKFAGQSLPAYVEWWRHDQQLVDNARRKLGSRCQIFRYEDVVADESKARLALQALCPDRQMGPNPSADRSLAGEGNALALPWETWKAGYDGPVTTARIESWRSRLSAADAAFIERATAAEMQKWGYVPDAALLRGPSKRRERFVKRIRFNAYRTRQSHALAQTVDLR
jgi:hypothetical protein